RVRVIAYAFEVIDRLEQASHEVTLRTVILLRTLAFRTLAIVVELCGEPQMTIGESGELGLQRVALRIGAVGGTLVGRVTLVERGRARVRRGRLPLRDLAVLVFCHVPLPGCTANSASRCKPGTTRACRSGINLRL